MTKTSLFIEYNTSIFIITLTCDKILLQAGVKKPFYSIKQEQTYANEGHEFFSIFLA